MYRKISNSNLSYPDESKYWGLQNFHIVVLMTLINYWNSTIFKTLLHQITKLSRTYLVFKDFLGPGKMNSVYKDLCRPWLLFIFIIFCTHKCIIMKRTNIKVMATEFSTQILLVLTKKPLKNYKIIRKLFCINFMKLLYNMQKLKCNTWICCKSLASRT